MACFGLWDMNRWVVHYFQAERSHKSSHSPTCYSSHGGISQDGTSLTWITEWLKLGKSLFWQIWTNILLFVCVCWATEILVYRQCVKFNWQKLRMKSGGEQVEKMGPLVVQCFKCSACNAGDMGLIPGLGRSLEKEWQPTPIFLHGKSHGPWSLVGYSPWGCKELDTT